SAGPPIDDHEIIAEPMHLDEGQTVHGRLIGRGDRPSPEAPGKSGPEIDALTSLDGGFGPWPSFVSRSRGPQTRGQENRGGGAAAMRRVTRLEAARFLCAKLGLAGPLWTAEEAPLRMADLAMLQIDSIIVTGLRNHELAWLARSRGLAADFYAAVHDRRLF